MVVGLRALSLVVASIALACTEPWSSSERDPDVPCPEDNVECWDGPPGPMPVIHAAPGETVTFHCYAYSPCAQVVVEDADGARSYVATITSELAGGFGVDTAGNSGFSRSNESYMCAQDTWCLGGFGFGASKGQAFSHQVPDGVARTWSFGFAPMSGQHGGDITLRVDLRDGPACEPAWRCDK